MISLLNIVNGFSIFGFEIKFYGIIIALGMLAGIFIARNLAKERGIEKDDIYTLALYVLPLAIIGARIYFVIFHNYSQPFWEVLFDFRGGGLAIYGGVIGGAVGVLLFCLIHKKNFLKVADVAVVALILGQAIGRWGNFINQEAYGNLITNSHLQWFPFGVYIKKENFTNLALSQVQDVFGSSQIDGAWFNATFFYESFFNLLIFFALFYLIKKIKIDGIIAGLYFVLYGFVRVVIEGFRTDSLYLGNTGIRVSQLLSAILIVVGIITIIFFILKDKWKKVNQANQTQLKKGKKTQSKEQKR